MRTATEQLPGFIFYLGAGGVLLLLVAALEAFGDRFSAKASGGCAPARAPGPGVG